MGNPNGSHSTTDKSIDAADVVPDSQPGVNKPFQSVSANSKKETATGNITSSSPLSDIGELFDPSDLTILGVSGKTQSRNTVMS